MQNYMSFYTKYIHFQEEDGRPYIEETGRGEPLTENSQNPVVEYNDVRHGRYFIVKYKHYIYYEQ